MKKIDKQRCFDNYHHHIQSWDKHFQNEKNGTIFTEDLKINFIAQKY